MLVVPPLVKSICLWHRPIMEKEKFIEIVKQIFPTDTQREFAAYIGVNQSAVSRWFTGDRAVPSMAVVIMAHLIQRKEDGKYPLLAIDTFFD